MENGEDKGFRFWRGSTPHQETESDSQEYVSGPKYLGQGANGVNPFDQKPVDDNDSHQRKVNRIRCQNEK